MSLLNSLARGVSASVVSSQLPPARYVSFDIDIAAGVTACICCLICCLSIFKVQDNTTSTDAATGKTTPVSPIKGYSMGVITALIAGCVVGGLLHQLRWNIENPAYYAASAGLNELFGSNRY